MELMMNEFSLSGQFLGYEDFEEYFINYLKDILEIIREKEIVLHKLSEILNCPVINDMTLTQILNSNHNTAAMAVLKSGMIQLMDDPYLDANSENTDFCLTDSNACYIYPNKDEEPNCFTEAIERACPMLSLYNERYCQREFFCQKDGQEVVLRNIQTKSDLLEVYLQYEPMEARYVIEHYPFTQQIVLAEVHEKCYAREALEENELESKDIQKIFFHISDLLSDLQNGRKSHWWDAIEGDIFEYRVSVSAGREFRLLFYRKEKLYFLNGFIKKSPKTPEREKEKARDIIKQIKMAI